MWCSLNAISRRLECKLRRLGLVQPIREGLARCRQPTRKHSVFPTVMHCRTEGLGSTFPKEETR